MAGYSGTPLPAKLGIKPGALVRALHAPRNYAALLGRLPQGAQLRTKLSPRADIVHLFTARKAEAPTDLTEDTIRATALPLGLVDVKVCAVTEVWSGLKLVLRKELR